MDFFRPRLSHQWTKCPDRAPFFIEIVADDEISAIQPVRNNVCYYHTKTNVILELEFVE